MFWWHRVFMYREAGCTGHRSTYPSHLIFAAHYKVGLIRVHLQVPHDILKTFFLTYWTWFEPSALCTEPFRTDLHWCGAVRCAVRCMFWTGLMIWCAVWQKGPLNQTTLNPGITRCPQSNEDIRSSWTSLLSWKFVEDLEFSAKSPKQQRCFIFAAFFDLWKSFKDVTSSKNVQLQQNMTSSRE